MQPPSFDIAQAHRWFAAQINNLAWDLVDQDERSPEDDQRMIHAAHAACWHWLHAGTSLNHQRALCLLAIVYAASGNAGEAMRYAAQCAALSEINGREQMPFDRATALACVSRAHAVAGNQRDATHAKRNALAIAAGFSEDERAAIEAMC